MDNGSLDYVLYVDIDGVTICLTGPKEILNLTLFIIQEYTNYINENIGKPQTSVFKEILSCRLTEITLRHIETLKFKNNINEIFLPESFDIRPVVQSRENYIRLSVKIESLVHGKWILEIPPVSSNSLIKVI